MNKRSLSLARLSGIFGLLGGLLAVTYLASSMANAETRLMFIPVPGEGPPVRVYYGSVQGIGSLETGNIDLAIRSSEGIYSLETGANVSGCAITVTKGSQGAGSANVFGNITAGVPSSGTAFSVRTRDSSGSLDDTDFHFIAICPK
ncbi:MAG: hypothetical protein AAFY29_05375 [Pseudomonadota bacterium]